MDVRNVLQKTTSKRQKNLLPQFANAFLRSERNARCRPKIYCNVDPYSFKRMSSQKKRKDFHVLPSRSMYHWF
eukprot:jgi/Botrbrau1/14252/Bobra.0381s0013.1